ncbi:hypothetical protein M433DRAFT_132612 [Acidomyces richmondensis BFW]|nr:MAG: hypothetical protein FE78DRAFT_28263 [Acidomyces sp. 'richmondensis']KYG47865.1 hypothetical protein M433DRAFT_132612 [Acidomyces richmondensis BFW]
MVSAITERNSEPVPSPSSPPPPSKYDVSVESPQHSIASRGRVTKREEQLLSPEIARLPPPRTPATARSRHRDDSSEYYTAVWGSPYARSTSPSGSVHTAWSELLAAETQIGSSPIPDFGLEHLLPSRLGNHSFYTSEAPLLHPEGYEEDTQHTPRSRTQRWVQLPRRQYSEKAHWWSDESPNVSEEDRSGSRRRRTSSVSQQSAERRSAKGHRNRDENRTLDQQSFLEALREGQSDDMSGLFASRWADTPPPEESEQDKNIRNQGAVDTNVINKRDENIRSPQSPLPDPPALVGLPEEQGNMKLEGSPVEEAVAAGGVGTLEQQGHDINKNGIVQSNASALKSGSKHLEPPRFRRKVSWRGKTCIVSLPNLDFDALGLPKPMTHEDVEARLKKFENDGYDVHGFDICHDVKIGDVGVHAKSIFPDEAESRLAASQGRPKILLPDLNKWKAYQDMLMEQKLAALGVVSAGEEPLAPPAQDMSRQSSGQHPPLAFSPPLPTGSGGNVGRPGMMRGHSHNMSIASPLSPGVGPFGHMHRHSTFTGTLGFPQLQTQLPLQQAQQIASPGMQAFLPQTHFGVPNLPPTGSPSQINTFRQDIGAYRATGSPLGQQIYPQTSQDYSRGILEDQLRRAQVYSQAAQPAQMPSSVSSSVILQAPTLQQTSNLPQLPEADDEEELNEPESDPEPTATLDPPAYVPPHKRAQLNEDVAIPTPTRGHRHNISEGLERDILQAEMRDEAQRRDMVDATEQEADGYSAATELSKTEPPQLKPVPEKDPLGLDLPVQESAVRNHKKTTSRFNITASKFTFNPKANFQPKYFEPPSTSFSFGTAPPQSTGAHSRGHSRQLSSGMFNVSAPAFQPTSFKPAIPSSLPQQDFGFTANGKPFEPTVPVSENPKQEDMNIIDELPSIFGKVKIPDIVKPSRKSKAITIVRPDESDRKERSSSEDRYDDEGRLKQSEARLKRQRKANDDGDEVPKFAERPETPVSKTPPTIDVPMVPSQLDQENASKVVKSLDIAIADENGNKEGETEEAEREQVQAQSGATKGIIRKHGHKASTSLSALAKPFVPTAPNLPKTDQSDAEHAQFGSISDLEEGEVRDDKKPNVSPILISSEAFVSPSANARPQMPEEHPSSERIDIVAQPDPSFDEIDAVMRHLNEADENEQQAQRDQNPVSAVPEMNERPIDGVTYLPEWNRSDGTTPSPVRRQKLSHAQLDSSSTDHHRTDIANRAINGWPPINRLNRHDDEPPSDWSGVLSPQEEEKLHARSTFFESHIEDVIGRVVERHLQPLEEGLRSIQTAVNKRARSSDWASLKRSSSAVDSDADDEDDMSDEQRRRPTSRGRDKRMDQLKVVVMEALREQSPRRTPSSSDLADLHSALADMKVSFARAASASLELEDIRAVVEDVLYKQGQAVVPIAMEGGQGDHKRELSELESRLNETLAGALEEANLRRSVEEREAESRRLLRLAEEELQLLRESSKDEGARRIALEEERRDLFERFKKAEHMLRSNETKVETLEAENEAMQKTLEEYRISSNKWRQDVDEGLRERKALEDTIAELERQLADGQESANSMKRRLEKLHEDMASAVGQLASEKVVWKAREEDYRVRCESLEALQASHARERRELEEELRVVRASLAEVNDTKGVLAQLRASNSTLEDMVRKLQADLAEQQSLAARWERDFHDARDAGRAEVQRTRMAMETDLEVANHQVNMVRASLERDLLKVQAELDSARIELETQKARHERVLEEEGNERREAIRKVNQASSIALDEARSKYETASQEMAARHARALEHALEDKQRSEYILHERLELSNAKLQHAQERISYLQERLAVATSAAQAAAASAQTRGMPVTSASANSPEKISPQALRESILVLQEQLQEREARIERLQNAVDKEGPAKLKERDTEISWLRELLAVRNEDLTELINTLARPSFDRDEVRDAAIRIRANLQMELQEKERVKSGSQSLSSQAIASLSSFATPKASQLTSAFNKWRSNMESSALRNPPRSSGPSNAHARSSTPSKTSAPAIPSNFLAGLMTPPASNLRTTPSPETTLSLPPPRLNSRDGSKSSALPHSRPVSISSEGSSTLLFREQNYDRDAEDSEAHMQSFADDDLDVPDSEAPAFRSLEAELGQTEADADSS